MISLQKRKFKLYSPYIQLIFTIAISFVVFYFFVAEKSISYYVYENLDVLKLSKLFQMISVIFLFLIFNTSYYSLVSYKRIRMMVFSIVFLTTGCMSLLHLVNNTSLLNNLAETVQQNFLYSSFDRLLLAIGLLVASIIPIDKKIEKSGSLFIRITPIVAMAAFVVLNNMFVISLNNLPDIFDVRLVSMLIEYVIAIMLIITIVFYLRTYSYFRNQNMDLTEKTIDIIKATAPIVEEKVTEL